MCTHATSPDTTSNAVTRPLPSDTYISPLATTGVGTQPVTSRIEYAQTSRRSPTFERLIRSSGLNPVTS